MDQNHAWDMKKYLEKRTRSKQEEEMHQLLQEVSKGKLTVEEMQFFFDKTTRPLDFMRKYGEKIDFSNEREANKFMNLLMELWNQTPRTELHGNTSSQVYNKGEKRCELCATKPKCPHCEVELTERETRNHPGDEVTELFCKKCNNTFQDFKTNMSIEPDEETEKLFKEIATIITEDTFDGVWVEAKKDIKDFSKKELAEEMFFAGAVNSFVSIYALGIPREMFEIWAKFLGGQEQDIEEAMEKLKRKMEELKND